MTNAELAKLMAARKRKNENPTESGTAKPAKPGVVIGASVVKYPPVSKKPRVSQEVETIKVSTHAVGSPGSKGNSSEGVNSTSHLAPLLLRGVTEGVEESSLWHAKFPYEEVVEKHLLTPGIIL